MDLWHVEVELEALIRLDTQNAEREQRNVELQRDVNRRLRAAGLPQVFGLLAAAKIEPEVGFHGLVQICESIGHQVGARHQGDRVGVGAKRAHERRFEVLVGRVSRVVEVIRDAGEKRAGQSVERHERAQTHRGRGLAHLCRRLNQETEGLSDEGGLRVELRPQLCESEESGCDRVRLELGDRRAVQQRPVLERFESQRSHPASRSHQSNPATISTRTARFARWISVSVLHALAPEKNMAGKSVKLLANGNLPGSRHSLTGGPVESDRGYPARQRLWRFRSLKWLFASIRQCDEIEDSSKTGKRFLIGRNSCRYSAPFERRKERIPLGGNGVNRSPRPAVGAKRNGLRFTRRTVGEKHAEPSAPR